MKKILTFIMFISSNISLFSNDRDSIQMYIFLEKDTVDNSVNLVFENLSNDTILLISDFENFFTEFKSVPGFRIFFYLNDCLVSPEWGELPKKYYTFSEGRIYLYPRTKVKFPIELPYWRNLKRADSEYKIKFQINYRYINIKSKKFYSSFYETEYLVF